MDNINEKIIEFQDIINKSLSNDVTELSRENIKLREKYENMEKCFNEILEYMNDHTVTWRDITDDIINEILKQY